MFKSSERSDILQCTKISDIVISRLDYCSSLLYGLPETTQLIRLRRIHHHVARLITHTGHSVDMPIVLKSLHWIPIEYRICFKILCNVYKAVNGLVPQYLSDLLTPYVPSRKLRSKDLSLVVVPKTNLKIGKKVFQRLWSTSVELTACILKKGRIFRVI